MCEHKVMVPQQHWDECANCGARWHPDHGWKVPLARRAKFQYGVTRPQIAQGGSGTAPPPRR